MTPVFFWQGLSLVRDLLELHGAPVPPVLIWSAPRCHPPVGTARKCTEWPLVRCQYRSLGFQRPPDDLLLAPTPPTLQLQAQYTNGILNFCKWGAELMTDGRQILNFMAVRSVPRFR